MSGDRVKNVLIALVRRTLPDFLKCKLYHFAFNIAPAEAHKFACEYLHLPDMGHGLSAMARLGFSPQTIIDVGAFRGEWAQMAASVWPKAKVLMYEPNAAKNRECREVACRLGATLHEKLVGAEDGRAVSFYVMDNGSSVFPERSPLTRTVETKPLVTLDSTVGSLMAPVLVKIDAQGYELEILKGAPKVLAQAAAVVLEASTIEINEGCPLLHEVIDFMRRREFVVYDVVGMHRRPLDRALNQLDLVFVPRHSWLLADKRHWA